MDGEFRRLMMGSTHNTIYMPDIKSLRFGLPPMEQQAEIVEYVREMTSEFDPEAFHDVLSNAIGYSVEEDSVADLHQVISRGRKHVPQLSGHHAKFLLQHQVERICLCQPS
jgi:hypothetical protein